MWTGYSALVEAQELTCWCSTQVVMKSCWRKLVSASLPEIILWDKETVLLIS